VLPRRTEDEFDLPGVPARLVDGLVEVELRREPGPRQLPQPSERDAHLPRVEREIGPVIREPPLLRDLHRRPRPRLPADADPGRMRPIVPVWRPSPSPDPPPAPVVPLRLLRERLEELAHELVRRQPFQLRELLRRQLRQILRLPKPLENLLRDVVAKLPLNPLEHPRKHPIVSIEVRLTLHQTRSTEVVKAQQVGSVQPELERRQEPLPLLDGDGHPFIAKAVKQIEEHLRRSGWIETRRRERIRGRGVPPSAAYEPAPVSLAVISVGARGRIEGERGYPPPADSTRDGRHHDPHPSRSMIVALAIPPPSHIVWRPQRPPVRSRMFRSVAMSRAPLHPSG